MINASSAVASKSVGSSVVCGSWFVARGVWPESGSLCVRFRTALFSLSLCSPSACV